MEKSDKPKEVEPGVPEVQKLDAEGRLPEAQGLIEWDPKDFPPWKDSAGVNHSYLCGCRPPEAPPEFSASTRFIKRESASLRVAPSETPEHYKSALQSICHTLFAAGQLLRDEQFRCPVSGAAWVILGQLAKKTQDIRDQVCRLADEAAEMGEVK